MKLLGSFLYTLVVIEATVAAGLCAPLGVILPSAPDPLSTDRGVLQAAKSLTTSFTKLLSTDNGTSVAVQMTSLTDPKPLFEFYRTAPIVNLTGAHRVTHQTLFRLASVTKVYTVLSMLQQEDKFDWRDPITHYVPELLHDNDFVNDVKSVRWDEVTLDALASQLGVSREIVRIQDLALLYKLPWAEFGFPSLNSTELPSCGVATNLPPCNASVRHPAFKPYKGPVYSNAAYALLGLALERIVGRGYTDIVQEGIFQPLGLTNSSINMPHSEKVLIPTGDSQWDLDDGFIRPTRQLYKSISDLSAFAVSILNSTLLTPTQTNRWLKPRSHTSSLTASVGAPWEIYRTDALTSDGRIIDLYTKNGGLGQYASYLVLVPDYNVAITVLAAGPSTPLNQITSSMLKTMIPAIDGVARNHAAKKYVGAYNSENCSSNMSLVMTDTGLHVKEWFNNGKDVLAAYASVFQPIDLAIYPSGLHDPHNEPHEESWRGFYRYTNSPYDNLLDQCSPWLGIDGNVYGQEALDEFIFELDAESKVMSVRNSAMTTVLKKRGRA